MTGRAKDAGEQPAKPKDEAPQSGFVKVPAEPKADPEDTGKPWGGQQAGEVEHDDGTRQTGTITDRPAPKADPPKAQPKTSDRT